MNHPKTTMTISAALGAVLSALLLSGLKRAGVEIDGTLEVSAVVLGMFVAGLVLHWIRKLIGNRAEQENSHEEDV